ncbi:hypothetical protein ACFQ1S_00120 [Kibdelosporangium lantanae]|uniref:Uncharacterized protein n=1 Tax=Kibdelosporangium lantanae TaxID=1497396 RepID=A0ABW3M2A3_9PSEU
MLRLLPTTNTDKDTEIQVLRHQLAILQRQVRTPRLTPHPTAFPTALPHRLRTPAVAKPLARSQVMTSRWDTQSLVCSAIGRLGIVSKASRTSNERRGRPASSAALSTIWKVSARALRSSVTQWVAK